MAPTRQRDILEKLAGAGEEAINRVASSQATSRLFESMTGMRERVEELQKRLTGLDNLEKRVTKLEKALADQSKPKTTRARSTTPRSTARKAPSSTTRRKPPASS